MAAVNASSGPNCTFIHNGGDSDRDRHRRSTVRTEERQSHLSPLFTAPDWMAKQNGHRVKKERGNSRRALGRALHPARSRSPPPIFRRKFPRGPRACDAGWLHPTRFLFYYSVGFPLCLHCRAEGWSVGGFYRFANGSHFRLQLLLANDICYHYRVTTKGLTQEKMERFCPV